MPPKKMTDDELQAIVDGEFDAAMGGPGGEISTERAEAWDYYMQKPFGNEVEGESQVVTSDVADAVDGIMPSLLRIFTTADNLVNFDPVGREDAEAAAQESDYVNHVFFKMNNAFLLLYHWFFDGLVQKNGYVKAFWDERERVTTESYKGLSEAELDELLADEELEAVERAEREVPPAEAAGLAPPMGAGVMDQELAASLELGMLPPPPAVKVHDVVFRRTAKRGQVRVDNVPPEEMRISSDSRSVSLDECRFVGQEREATRSELVEMGFDKATVDDLPSVGADEAGDSEEKTARLDKSDETEAGAPDASMEKVLVREGYPLLDFDGDGKAERRRVLIAGGSLLENEPADRQPFHAISPQPLPHKHFGRAFAERVMDTQQKSSTLWRQMLMNLYHTNNPGHAIWEGGIGENTLDDLLTTRVGRAVRFQRPVGESWMPMAVPFTAASTFPVLELLEKEKRNRTGVNPEGFGLTPDALKNIQTTVLAQASDLSRMKIEAVARIFAETGIKSLMLHIHELLLKHQRKDQVVRLRNKWVMVSPQEWRERFDVTVTIGLGLGTREQNMLHLNAIWEKQREIVAGGGLNILVTPKNIYRTAAEFVKNANLQEPGLFFTDPGDQAFSPAQGEEQQLAQLQAKLAARQQELDAAKQQLDREKILFRGQMERERLVLQDRRESERIEIARQAEMNKVAIAMEGLANKLTELELQYRTNVPGSRV